MSIGAGILNIPRRADTPTGGGQSGIETIAADIAAIRERHVPPPQMLIKTVTLDAVGAEDTLDTQSRSVSWLLIQCFTGILDIYIGEGGAAVPHMRYEPTPFPVVVPVSVRPYKFTLRAVTAGTSATVIAVS